jgi:hypothetical protein
MQPILKDFLDIWVYPSGFSGPESISACVKPSVVSRSGTSWLARQFNSRRMISSQAATSPKPFARGPATPPRDLLCRSSRCRRQILSVAIDEQSQYVDLQRMRARQIWDEVKHGQLHADVLLRGGWIEREEELMDDPRPIRSPSYPISA